MNSIANALFWLRDGSQDRRYVCRVVLAHLCRTYLARAYVGSHQAQASGGVDACSLNLARVATAAWHDHNAAMIVNSDDGEQPSGHGGQNLALQTLYSSP